MPWSTPTLSEVRGLVRDNIHLYLPGSDAAAPNSVLRVMSDVQGALCHLTLQYIDWLALQLLPDTAETEWLDRHGQIWLVNSDGTVGRKQATLASGTVTLTGNPLAIVPAETILVGADNGVQYQTLDQITIDPNAPTPVPARAITPGIIGNLPAGTIMALQTPPPGIDNEATVVTMDGGVDPETDDELRARILKRIREPPMGGDKTDYEQWALAVPGVTRAWCSPNEMGIGTVTVRFMCDDLRADNGGFPLQTDIDNVTAYIDQKRPVTVKDRWVLSPIPETIDIHIGSLSVDNDATRGAIQQNILNMLFANAAPGQEIFAVWKTYAIMNSPGVVSFDLLDNADDIMPSLGHMAVLGDIYYDGVSVSHGLLIPSPPATKGQ
jgi:uncharacterized phage protein gp47/JayE